MRTSATSHEVDVLSHGSGQVAGGREHTSLVKPRERALVQRPLVIVGQEQSIEGDVVIGTGLNAVSVCGAEESPIACVVCVSAALGVRGHNDRIAACLDLRLGLGVGGERDGGESEEKRPHHEVLAR